MSWLGLNKGMADIAAMVDELAEAEIALLIPSSNDVAKLNAELVTYYTTDRNALCLYVTVTRPASTIQNQLRKQGADTDNVFYIDCATPLAGSGLKRAENAVFVKPQKLSDISISVTEALKSLPADREKILILDTLTTLMLYNDENVVSKFAHSLVTRLRERDITGVLLTVEEETDEDVKAQLTQFCDCVIQA